MKVLGLLAFCDGIAASSIEILSSQLFQSGVQTQTHAITIPSDCDCIIVNVSGFVGIGESALLAALNFDGSSIDFDRIGFASYNVPPLSCQVDCYFITKSSPHWPGTGAHNLHLAGINNPGEGLNVGVVYLKNALQSGPVVDVEVCNSGLALFTSAFVSLSPDDLVMICAYNYSVPPGLVGNDVIVIAPTVFDSAGFGVGTQRGANVSAQGEELVALAWVMR